MTTKRKKVSTMAVQTKGPLAAARAYGTSEAVAAAVQAANPTAGATALAQARKHGLSEWAVLGIEAASATVPARMAAPVAAAGAAGTATVTFTAPADNGGLPITGYRVVSSTGKTQAVTSSPATITGLTAGATTFTVEAYNAVGYSTPSPASNSITVT